MYVEVSLGAAVYDDLERALNSHDLKSFELGFFS